MQFQTHRSGNILDLLLSDITQSTGLLTVAPGPYISDHWAVIATLNIKKVCPKAEVREVRKLHKVTKEEWNNIINVDNLTLSGNLRDMVDSLDKGLARIQDEAAPKKKCTIPLRPIEPLVWPGNKRTEVHSEETWMKVDQIQTGLLLASI